MSKNIDLPRSLGATFSVSEARRLGVPRSRWDSPQLARPFRGARQLTAHHSLSDADVILRVNERDEALARMAALWAVLPKDAVFMGPSAAVAWGIPLERQRLGAVHVAVPFPRTPPRRPGVVGSRLRPHLMESQIRSGFPVLTAAATWASLARSLDTDELVVVADHLLCSVEDPSGFHPEAKSEALATRGDLSAVLELGKWWGAARLRNALALAREGSRSRPETLLRLILQRAGLPEPRLNHSISEGDAWLACGDLVYLDYRVCVEYQSAFHRSASRFNADIDRNRGLRNAGWAVVELTSTHVFEVPSEAVRRVRRELQNRGWAPA